jgi:hypothetical protein
MADEDGFFMSLEQQVFLVECRSVVELMIERTVQNLERATSEEEVHILLLDDVYTAHDQNGVQISGFQNALAAAVLLAAIERKKVKDAQGQR